MNAAVLILTLLLGFSSAAHAAKKNVLCIAVDDLRPTLIEACGLPLDEGAEGDSLLPLMNDPDRDWKSAAFFQYPRVLKKHGKVMGTSMRTDRCRFTQWRSEDGGFRQVERYHLENDPQRNENLARDPARQERIPALTAQLRAGWRKSRP